MKVVKADSAGFCFGVKRAVDQVYKEIEESQGVPIYTYGPIIHNEEVTKDFASKGVTVISSIDELKVIKEGVVVIRSHGVTKEVGDSIKQQGLKCVDATCPFVKKIHRLVQKASLDGHHIVIVGNPTHPEVEGIIGWAENRVTVVQSVQDALEFELSYGEKISIVSQTTFNYKKFEDIVEIFSEKSYDIVILNTICSATKKRQSEASKIAQDVDAMIVIGDKHSSNSQKLFEICKKACNNTHYIQTLKDLDMDQLKDMDTVGITAGASTPNNIIEEVQINVRIKL